jgi:transposase
MSHAFSMDLRKRLVSAVDDGMTRRSAASRFGVSPSTAIRWVDQWRRKGHVEPDRQGGDNRSQRMEAHADEIIGLIEETPDITLAEIAEHLEDAHGLRVAQSTVWRLLDRHGITFKKNRARQRTTTA